MSVVQVFVGDSFVGKTSLINRLFSDRFEENTGATIGCDFKYKRYLFDGRSVGVTVWDTAGSEKFSAVTSSYYRGAQGVVLVYDVTRRESFDRLAYWLKEVSRVGSHPDTIRMIVGNKLDLVQPSRSWGRTPTRGGQGSDGGPGAGAGDGSSGCGDGGSGSPGGPMRPAAAQRQVSAEEAAAFARQHGWIVDTPSLHRANMQPAMEVETRRQKDLQQHHRRSPCGC
ncbi:MAG: hypothetical protein WDW38_000892 [Sanguina aurantia]